jgi:phage shock protein A
VASLQETIKANQAANPDVSGKVKELLDAVTQLVGKMQGRLDTTQIAAIEARLRSLESLLKPRGGNTTSPSYTAELKDIKTAIEAINTTLTNAKIGERLGGIDTKLDAVKGEIQRTAPRANVRGTAEGGAR